MRDYGHVAMVKDKNGVVVPTRRTRDEAVSDASSAHRTAFSPGYAVIFRHNRRYGACDALYFRPDMGSIIGAYSYEDEQFHAYTGK